MAFFGYPIYRFPILGAKSVYDMVYVDNVVLGHLLCEAKMADGTEGICGEAFNISNDEPVSVEDFWFSVKEHHRQLGRKTKTSFYVTYIPEAPLWILAYISELNQRLFKGKISLGSDLDALTPATLITGMMTYSYVSKKAHEKLGYVPAFTMDEGMQRSIADYYKLKNPNA